MFKFIYIKNFFLIKWIFIKPQQNKILVYDRQSIHLLDFLLKKGSYEILDVRYESINLYVLIKTLKKSFFKNIIRNYKINYISFVNPKFVITSIDNNLNFYNLKNNYNKTKYIVIQNGRRDNIFFKQCQNYYKKNNIKLSVDYFFTLGKNESKRFSKYIISKFFILGSVKNNYFYLDSLIKCKKNILFITRKSNFFDNKNHEVKVFNSVYKYSVLNNYNLILSARDASKEEKYYRSVLIDGNWQYQSNDVKSTYELVNTSEIIVYTNSTLGLEALVKFKKVALFLINAKYFPILGYEKSFPEKTFFWTTSSADIEIIKLLNRIKNCPIKKWQNIVKKYISNVIHYNPKNKIFFKIINNIK